MQINSKTFENNAEQTITYKNFIKGLNRTKSFGQSAHSSAKRRANLEALISPMIKKSEQVIRRKKISLDVDTVGEEGTAQVIKSPIVKRGKSSNSSLDITNSGNLLPNNQNLVVEQEMSLSSKIEINHLKQENIMLRSHIKILQLSITDLQKKLDESLKESSALTCQLEDLILDNKKTLLENERLLSVISTLENDSFRNSKTFLQDDLEAKILSLDKEKEEKKEQMLQILVKFMAYLNEFTSSDEWVLNLLKSPQPKKEIKKKEECMRNRVDRIQLEIASCQAQINAEKGLEKSYYTSLSSSQIPSPLNSPSRTIRLASFSEFINYA
ncbi:hypothetical protein SteCoe_26188 [Stentor coeruleus]|uniref:Uncharacterized protein n=1 Tax=Stentor coeruleus TaxID=5963 RepID=A0A1R2BDF9_9CILI|nr:hypothetical protein SteCoe_26188 [Stentor coeruleus]